MMTDPIVSIFTSVRNAASWLPAYFESTLGQTYGDLEVVVNDNASTDGTGDLLDEAARTDPRLRVHRSPYDLGMDDGFRMAYSLSRGRYAKLASVDDRIRPTCIERLVAPLLAHPELVLASSSRDKIDEHGVVTDQWVCFEPIIPEDGGVSGRAYGDLSLTTCMHWVGDPLFRTDLVALEDIFRFGGRDFPSAGDVALSLHLLSQGDAWFVVDKLSQFCVHAGQDGASFRRICADTTSWIHYIVTGRSEGFLQDAEQYRSALVNGLTRAVDTYTRCRESFAREHGSDTPSPELTALAEAIGIAGAELTSWERTCTARRTPVIRLGVGV
jgi:glycosyltransferase involved in cell wall biosynthesis